MRGKQMLNGAPTPQSSGRKWGWFLALGIVLVITGFLAGAYVIPTSFIATMFIGYFITFAGLVQIVQAFSVVRWGQFFLWLIAGIIYTAAGILCIIDPFAALPLLTLLLAAFFIISGVLRMIIGFRVHYVNGAAWVIINGIVTTLLGIIIVTQWPISSVWVFGLLIAIDLIFQGIGWIAYAFGLKALRR